MKIYDIFVFFIMKDVYFNCILLKKMVLGFIVYLLKLMEEMENIIKATTFRNDRYAGKRYN
jgi:hypothetical protein